MVEQPNMRVTRRSLSVASALLLVSVTVAHAEYEQWLQYRTSRRSERIFGKTSRQRLEITTRAPSGLPLPKLISDAPLFAAWTAPMAASGHLWLVLDQSTHGDHYDRLYMDTTVNGDLSDEGAVLVHTTDSGRVGFGPVKIRFQGDDGPVSYHLNLRCDGYENENERELVLYAIPGCWYEGLVTVAGAQYWCMLIDHNANGTFSDSSMSFDAADRIRIGRPSNLAERFVGKYIQIEETLYLLEVARDGAFVSFRAAGDVPMGALVVRPGISSLSVGGVNGLLDARVEDGLAALPAGRYRLREWEIKHKDEQGVDWQLQGSSFPDESVLEVREGAEIGVDIGEPVTSALRAQEQLDAWTFTPALQGKLGEAVKILRAGGRAPAPRLRIKNADGSYSRIYRFKYG